VSSRLLLDIMAGSRLLRCHDLALGLLGYRQSLYTKTVLIELW